MMLVCKWWQMRTGAGQISKYGQNKNLLKALHVPEFQNPTDGCVVRSPKCQPRGDKDGKLYYLGFFYL